MYALGQMGLELPQTEVAAIQELDQGSWVRQPRAETYTEAVLREIQRQGKHFKAPGGESMHEVGVRMLDWAESTFSDDKSDDSLRRALVFTHGIAIKCLASIVHDWSHHQTYTSVTDNTSLTLFTRNDGRWNMEYLGRKPE
jgi:broad specificity phosphatase PhoE